MKDKMRTKDKAKLSFGMKKSDEEDEEWTCSLKMHLDLV